MSSINSNYLILPKNYCQNSQIQNKPAFRGVESNPLPAQTIQPSQLSYPPDTVEISAKNKIKTKPKEKMSTGAKVGITALGILGSLVTACILISKHQTSKLTKLYNEKNPITKPCRTY